MDNKEYAICIGLSVIITLLIIHVVMIEGNVVLDEYRRRKGLKEGMYDTGILPSPKEFMVYDGGMLKNIATVETMKLPDRDYRTLIKNYENPALADKLY